jgi:DNA-binding CsgD family transcriptional regulator
MREPRITTGLEYAVGCLVVGGKANKEIAYLLRIDDMKVVRNIQRLKQRFGARNRAHLVAKWLTEGKF